LHSAGNEKARGTAATANCASSLTIMVGRPLTSAAGVLALLSDPNETLRQHALVALNPLVPQFWAEISENLTEMYASSPPSMPIS
jgi:hypothetical protein